MSAALEACFSTLSRVIGAEMEPISVIRCAEEHRRYWRPSKPRIILLAESHVYTTATESESTIHCLSFLPPDLPRGFVRLVYCLGYGEDALLSRPLAARNTGTPQFWKIFLSCLRPVTSSEDFAGLQASHTKPLEERIANKIRVLEGLRQSGVWLLDASIAALYLPGQPKRSPAVIERALHASWDQYIRCQIEQGAPQAVLCIGLGVAKCLYGRLEQLGIPWSAVPQPNARLSSAEHFDTFQKYYRICRDPALVGGVVSDSVGRIVRRVRQPN